MHQFKIRRILLEREAGEDSIAQRIRTRLPDVPITPVAPDDLALDRDIEELDKQSLRMVHFSGEFLKPCPGTPRYICCGYQILHVGINCPMDCSYCFLQSYLNQPSLRIFSNLANKLDAIGAIIDSHPGRIFRIGTGEFTDSLALDYLIGWTDTLLPFFSSKRNCILELKTKTTCIENLLKKRDVGQRIIVAWSLNTPRIIAHEERNTASLESRILAARSCQKAGYVVAFHFDPLIHYPGWREEYEEVVQLMERHLDPETIIWISMGSFRYMPDLKWVIKRRFPKTQIFDGEFIKGLDGKLRYFKPIRVEMYANLFEKLKKWYDDLGVYLCMESDDVWSQSLGWSPEKTGCLSEYLDERVKKLMRG
ncbi:MAG: DNA photolyase [Deltaproteobacteria bacterium]|nr:DNA photolyase [Deltaproteobacteria bacterium]MBW2076813.1 DNA photolyase [Deltaproteobacteria bacterium]